MRRSLTLTALITFMAVLGFSIRAGVFAQDATPIGDSTPVNEVTEVAATPTPAATGLTLVFIEHATSDTTIDLGDEGDSIGDLLAFANDVFDESNTTKVGTDQGSCILTIPGEAYECAWTLTLDEGQLMVQGPFLINVDSELAITGGTRIYTGATGQMILHGISDTEFQFTYEIQ
jgi:allene oxide cyclase